MKKILTMLLLFLTVIASAQSKKRPKVGLALSGGGAKGLSHVGVLLVLEKAGVQVDYIAGTSMGSIIGGLYAAGYSPDSIQSLITQEPWSLLLSNSPDLTQIVIEEKSEYGKYIVEMPLLKNRFVIPRGLIDGQELSVEFSRAFSSVYQTKKFSDLPIPFQCVATDITTGELVVLDSGNLAEAIRASMAIPSVFTPVKYNGRLLVDGGIVRNFPVSNVKKMGADIVIGANLSKGFMPESELESVFDILNQSMFLVDNEDTKNQRDLCNILIEPDLTGFSAGSFFSADSLIKRGYDAAMQHFDQLKNLADSLNRIYGVPKKKENRLRDSISIEAFYIEGVKRVDPGLIIGKMALPKNRKISLNEVPEAIRKVYGTRYFRRINYELIPDGKSAKLLIKTTENPNSYFKFAINYNSFTGSALILNFTTRNTLGKRTRFLTTLNVSENFRAKSEYYFYFGPKQNFGLGLGAYYDRNDYPIYSNLVKTAQFKQNYTGFDLKLQVSSLTVNSSGIGVKKEFMSISPEILGLDSSLSGGLEHWNIYAYFLLNTQNRPYFPSKGTKTNAELSYIIDSRYNFSNISSGPGGRTSVTVPDSVINKSVTPEYMQFKLSSTRCFPLNSKWTFIAAGYANFTFDVLDLNRPTNTFFNNFIVGGLAQNFRNQIPFMGVNEYQLNTNNFVGGMTGIQHEFIRNFFLTGRVNAGNYVRNFKEYFISSSFGDVNRYLVGYGATISYFSILGPLDISVMHSPQINSFSTYVNLGFNF